MGRVYVSESAARRGSSVGALLYRNVGIPEGCASIGPPASRVDMYLIEQSTN